MHVREGVCFSTHVAVTIIMVPEFEDPKLYNTERGLKVRVK